MLGQAEQALADEVEELENEDWSDTDEVWSDEE